MNLNITQSNNLLKLNFRDLKIFLAPVLIFLLYLFVYNPGVLTVASYSQLHQIAANEITSAYPVLYTFFEIVCLNIFKTPVFIGLFQILIFAVLWTVICKYHRNDSSEKISKEFILQFIVTVIICLIPINAIYSITLSSNVLFSYSLMFLCFLIKVMIDKNGDIDTKFSILLALTLAAVCGFNNYGIIIALISSITILYYLYKHNASENTFLMLIGLIIVCILLVGSLNLIYDVKGSNYDAFTYKTNIPSNDAFEDEINIDSAKDQFFSSTNFEPKESYETVSSANYGNWKYNIMDSFVNLFRGNFILGGLFDNPMLYMFLSVILLSIIYISSPYEQIYLMYVPPLANLVVNLLTGQNNLYSNLLVFYLIVIIFISLRFKSNVNIRDIKNLAPLTNKQEKVKSPPRQLRRPQNYVSDDDYYSDLESEIDKLTIDDINEMLGKPPREKRAKIDETSSQGSSDLVDEILKEIEMGKK